MDDGVHLCKIECCVWDIATYERVRYDPALCRHRQSDKVGSRWENRERNPGGDRMESRMENVYYHSHSVTDEGRVCNRSLLSVCSA